MIPLTRNSRTGKTIMLIETRAVVKDGGGDWLEGYEGTFWGDGNALYLEWGMGYIGVPLSKLTELHI